MMETILSIYVAGFVLTTLAISIEDTRQKVYGISTINIWTSLAIVVIWPIFVPFTFLMILGEAICLGCIALGQWMGRKYGKGK